MAELEARPRQHRVFISRIRRDDEIIEPDPDTVVREGDVIAVLTRSELLAARGTEIGAEVSDKELLDFPIEFLDVVVTNKSFVGKTIIDLAAMEFAKGVFLKKVTRVGEMMPFSPATRVERGDVMTLIGATRDVERAAKELGYADRETVMTDIDLRGLGHRPRRLIRIAHSHSRRPAAYPHCEWGGVDHGSDIRLAARSLPDVRSHSGIGHVDL